MTTAASYENATTAVPMLELVHWLMLSAAPAPTATAHVSEVTVDHDVVAHAEAPIVIVAETSICTKFSPTSVLTNPEVPAALTAR